MSEQNDNVTFEQFRNVTFLEMKHLESWVKLHKWGKNELEIEFSPIQQRSAA